MKSYFFLASILACILSASCISTFQRAKVSRIDQNPTEVVNQQGLIHQYRISGLPQMWIHIDPDEGFPTRRKGNSFTQEELSKLTIKVVSLSGKMSVNGLKINTGKTLTIDLKKDYNMYGEGGVKDFGKYITVIRFVSSKDVPAGENLCDFILTIEDPEGITRTTGLRVHGGFMDSL